MAQTSVGKGSSGVRWSLLNFGNFRRYLCPPQFRSFGDFKFEQINLHLFSDLHRKVDKYVFHLFFFTAAGMGARTTASLGWGWFSKSRSSLVTRGSNRKVSSKTSCEWVHNKDSRTQMRNMRHCVVRPYTRWTRSSATTFYFGSSVIKS